MFSKACEYGIRAAVYISVQSLEGNRVNVNQIAEKIDSPVAFTAKILQLLTKNHIAHSVKGPAGGFEIDTTRMKSIQLSEIVRAIDGDNIYVGCGLGLTECNAEKPCPLHEKFVAIRANLKTMLTTTSLYELAIGLEEGMTFLKR